MTVSKIALSAHLVRQASEFLRLRAFDISTAEGRAKERYRRVALAAFASFFARVVSIGTALVSVPLTLHYLGPERYGMWVVMSSLIAFLSFADLGVGNGVLTLVAATTGKGDLTAIRKIVSSAFFALGAISMSLLAAFVLLYPFVSWPKFFNVTSDLARAEAGPAFVVLATSIILSIPVGIVQKVQTGLQQGFLVSLWQSFGSLSGLAGVLATIWLEGGLPWLVFSFVTLPAFVTLLNNVSFFGLARPELRPRFALVNRATVRQITRTGFLFLVLQVAAAVAYASDSLIISQFLGPAAVGDYAVPEKLFSLVTVLLGMVLAPLWPAYGEALARGDHGWVRRTFRRSLIASVALAAAGSTALVAAGPLLLTLWVGREINPPFLLLLGLGVWKVVEAGGNSAAMFLNGANVVRLQLILSVSMGSAALLLKLFLIPQIGIAGAPLATSMSYFVFTALPLCVVIPRLIKRGSSL